MVANSAIYEPPHGFFRCLTPTRTTTVLRHSAPVPQCQVPKYVTALLRSGVRHRLFLFVVSFDPAAANKEGNEDSGCDEDESG